MVNKKIIEASELPENDKVFLKKDIFGWRIVHPSIDEQGNIIWKNLLFGGWRNLFYLIIFLLLIGYLFYDLNVQVTKLEDYYKNISEDPFTYCSNIINTGSRTSFLNNINYTFSFVEGNEIG